MKHLILFSCFFFIAFINLFYFKNRGGGGVIPPIPLNKLHPVYIASK